jgi:cold shock CspA family protein
MGILRWKTTRDGTVEFVEETEDGERIPVPPVPEPGAPAPASPPVVEAPASPPVVEQGTVETEAAAREPAGEGEQGPVEDPGSVAVVVERDASGEDADGRLRAGEVSFWHAQHEYGFIRPQEPSEQDVWVSVEALEGFAESLPHLAKRERVLYEAVASEVRSGGGTHRQEGRQRAIRVLPAQSRRRGVISEYSFMHGYGTITADDGACYFLHRSHVLGEDYQAVERGDEVFFTVELSETGSETPPGRDPQASAVKVGDPRAALYRFAQFPYDPAQWLRPLAKKAAPEDWGYHHEYSSERDPYPVLRHYMQATFERLLEQQRLGQETILEGTVPGGRAYAIFDTGLVDPMRRRIYALFDEHRGNDDPRRWWWRAFLTEEEGPMREVAALPKPADYLADPAALAITPGEVASMRVDTKHILGDHLDRFPTRLRSDPELARAVFEGALAELPDRIRRNYRLAVAQYYRGSIHLLLPLHLSGASRPPDLALVVERNPSGARRASTVLGADHAYRQARVIARLQTGWLAGAWLKPAHASPTSAGEAS